MKISINANRCESSPMRMFHPLAVAAKEAGKTIYHLNIGQPDLPTPQQFFDAISGDFSLQSAGYMIENGKKTTYVKSFTVAGNFYDLLKNIVALANNCELPRAMGMTAFGSPSVLVDGLSVAGK